MVVDNRAGAGGVVVAQFTEESVSDAARMALAEKVEVRHDEAITAKGAGFRHMVRVAVQLLNGEQLECAKEFPRGSERSFAAESDIVAKFEKLAAHALPQARIAELRDTILCLEKLPDAGAIVNQMA